jgi:hypothetical protein
MVNPKFQCFRARFCSHVCFNAHSHNEQVATSSNNLASERDQRAVPIERQGDDCTIEHIQDETQDTIIKKFKKIYAENIDIQLGTKKKDVFHTHLLWVRLPGKYFGGRAFLPARRCIMQGEGSLCHIHDYPPDKSSGEILIEFLSMPTKALNEYNGLKKIKSYGKMVENDGHCFCIVINDPQNVRCMNQAVGNDAIADVAVGNWHPHNWEELSKIFKEKFPRNITA